MSDSIWFRRCRRPMACAALAVLILPCRLCLAHADSEATVEARFDAGRLSLVWEGALRDLDHAMGLDMDGDGRVTRGEWDARSAEATQYVRAHLRWRHRGRLVPLNAGEWSHPDSWQGRGARLELTADVAAVAVGDRLEYDLFFEGDPWHRAHLVWTGDGNSRSRALLGPDHSCWSPEVLGPTTPQVRKTRVPETWPAVCAAAALIGILVWRLS